MSRGNCSASPTAHLLVLLFLFARLMPRLTGLFERAQTFATVLPAFRAFDDLEFAVFGVSRTGGRSSPTIAFDREIRFDRVSFSYSANPEAPALTDIFLRIPAGSMTAIVGASGAGKSTIADLLLGLIVPSRGSVPIHAEVLDSSRVSAWRGQIGYVNQDTFLFHDTVRANLLWARPGASEPELQHVLRLAAADDSWNGSRRGSKPSWRPGRAGVRWRAPTSSLGAGTVAPAGPADSG